MGVRGDKLDRPYIKAWCNQHGTRKLLENIHRTAPKLGRIAPLSERAVVDQPGLPD